MDTKPVKSVKLQAITNSIVLLLFIVVTIWVFRAGRPFIGAAFVIAGILQLINIITVATHKKDLDLKIRIPLVVLALILIVLHFVV
ncbi:MAG: hypothetical protein LHW64_02700 [Candidatus Cloacimonetes bacterium]|jgi:hypothetical protein|nr:hypothetical protein [Candidatus Cloacimonadota bacterium]MDY0229018.1 hypothetical protein [Candidatus Cloacimonadaceae bacterium]